MPRRPRRIRFATSDLSAIRDGDALLWRPTTLMGRLIAACGRSEYSHVGMAAWIDGVLTSLEMVQWTGGRAVPLFDLVKRYPGRCDWYQSTPCLPRADCDNPWSNTFIDFNREGAVKRMRRFVGKRYGWRAIALVSLRHMPIARMLCPIPTDDEHSHLPTFCSGAVSTACTDGGEIDPCPNLPHRLTEPGDLARSLLFNYRATLWP